MTRKIAACVVLYHPAIQVIDNIKSYYPYIDSLIVIDNSEKADADMKNRLQRTFSNLLYISRNENLGISKALNIAASAAIERRYDWLLTMDQDSHFAPGSLSQMIGDIDDIEKQYGDIGIISPLHLLTENAVQTSNEKYVVKNTTVTSGNLLNLKAYLKVGPFDEKLFIDFVDHEYCLRLRRNNYKIIQDNKALLNHSLGNFEIRRFLGKTIGVSHHNHLRRYYMTRNGLYVGRKHFSVDLRFFLYMLFEHYILSLVYITFFEKDKIRKLKSIIRGTMHFMIGKSGKVPN